MAMRGGSAPSSTMRTSLSSLSERFRKVTAACSWIASTGERTRFTMAGTAPSSTIRTSFSGSSDRFRSTTMACSWIARFVLASSAMSAGSLVQAAPRSVPDCA
eukprot:3887882-Rhodomonas_salina.1